MSTLESVHAAQHDLGQLQSALGAVSVGLDAVETAIEVADSARRGFSRFLRVAVVVGVIVAAVVIVNKLLSDNTDAEVSPDR
ncbi:MAG: hypothetical protein AAGG08_16750 [Actinomycetota bacterium]